MISDHSCLISMRT